MRIDRNSAIRLESIVREVFSCDRAGMGGYIDADHFVKAPFDAALIAIAPLWQRGDKDEIESFLLKWEDLLRGEGCTECDIREYLDQLSTLVADLKN